MAYTPGVGLASSSDSSGAMDEQQLSQRIRLISAQNPYMADNPSALVQMALSPISTDNLVANAGQFYAMNVGNKLSDQLGQMTPGGQRAVFARLTKGQQQALVQMGYKPPARDDSSLLGDIANVVKTPLSILGKGAAAIPGVKETVGATFDGLTWVANWPGHLYRTARLGDDQSQWMALAGGLTGLAAVALAIPTGGGSLMALGALGLGAIGGASAASFASNPTDWIRAFNSSWNGERTFSLDAQRRVDSMLGDPRTVGLAHDLAAQGIDVVEFAKEMAGHREIDPGSQLREIHAFAETMATPGTPEFQQTVDQLTTALSDPTFQQAVQTLNNSKISPGRDLGATLGLDPGSTLYNVVSGSTDALFTVAVDPTLMLGYGMELYKAKRFTFAVFEGSDAASAFRTFVKSRRTVMRNYNELGRAVELGERGGIQALRVRAPQMEALYGDLVEYRQALRDQKLLTRPFDGDHVIDYLSKETNFAPLLAGKGSVKNARGIQLIGTSAPKMAFREFRGEVRALVNGMADISTEAKYAKLIKEHGTQEALIEAIGEKARARGIDFTALAPPSLLNKISEDGLIAEPWRFNQHNPIGYVVGRAFADTARRVPLIGRSVGRVGEALTSMTTMSIAGKAVHIAGPEATKEIRALSELGRYMGMPSYWRQAWADVILGSDSPAARYNAMHGWLANMLRTTGIDHTDEGAKLVEDYLQMERKLYGASDEILINGEKMPAGIFLNEQADMVVMPDLREMRKAAQGAYLGKLMGYVDHPVLESMMNKVWKPAVLLRLGFIPRAAGEELASFVLRGGIGSLSQGFGARYLGRIEAYENALKRKAAGPFVSVFTHDEQLLLDQGLYATLPSHIRPLVRMMARVGFEDPAMRAFDRYGRFLAERLRSGAGVLEHADEAMARLGGQALDAPRFADRSVGGFAGILGKRGMESEARALGVTPLTAPGLRRLNVADYANSILLGNRYSLRRMLMGGVHNDLVEAGMEWSRMHSTTIMREASAINAGPIDPGFDHSQIHTVLETDPRTGELRKTVLMQERGQRVTLGYGDDHFAGALHENFTRPASDPAFSRWLSKYGTRVRSPNVQEAHLGPAADHLFDMGRHVDDPVWMPGTLARGDHARTLTSNFLGAFDRERWEGTLERMAQGEYGAKVAGALEAYTPAIRDLTMKDVISALDRHRTELAAAHTDRFKNLTTLEQRRQAISADVEGTKAYYAELTHFNKLIEDLHDHALPTLKYLDALPYADRQMAAQFLHQVSVGGEKSFWAQRRYALENQRINAAAGIAPPVLGDDLTTDKWLYNSFGQLPADSTDHLASLVLDPNLHDEGVTKSLRGVQTDEKGQFVDTQLRGATVMLYQAPDLHGTTFEDILAHAGNRGLIMQHEKVIRQMIEHPDDAVNLVADIRLAKELHRVDASIAGVSPNIVAQPRHLRADRIVTDGRIHGQLVPNTESKIAGETQLWHLNRKRALRRLEPTPDETVDRAHEWADKMIGRYKDVVRRGNTTQMTAKGQLLDDGQEVPAVFRWNNEELVPIQPGTRIPPEWRNQLHDAQGRKVLYEDSRVLQPEPLNTAAVDDAMWEALGPVMRDVHDNLHGATMLRRKRLTANPTKGEYALPSQLLQTADVTPVFHAKVTDIHNIPGRDLPSQTIGEIFSQRKVGTFEKVVQYGFDHVIGPSIDAIIRRPMAFHHFANRYINAKTALAWTIDPELVAKTSQLMREYAGFAHGVDINPEVLAKQARAIASFHGDVRAAGWTTNEALAWMRSYSKDDMADLLVKTLTQTQGVDTKAARAANAFAAQLAKKDFGAVNAALQSGTDMPSLIKTIENALPEGSLRSVKALQSQAAKDAIAGNPLLKWIDEHGHWDTIVAATKNLKHVSQTAGELAAVAAIGDVMPFLDSHEFKTQFADYGKGLLPFWYAEENFMKRWARGLADAGPALIRKGMLTYMGMKEAGIVRTDEAGRDWFVYPGSGLLVDAISRIPGMGGLQQMGVMFETPTDQMLPGLNNRFGTPSFNPLATIPMELAMKVFPELQPAERAMLGDFASGQGVVNQLVPAHFRNIFGALTGLTGENPEASNARIASAMMASIAYLEAHGDGLPDNATPGQTQDFLDRVRNHARIITLVRGIAGFVVPGSPAEIVAGKSANVLGLDLKDPQNYLASEYSTLVRDLGVEEGTAKFLELNKDATIDDVVNPLAYTIPKNESASGAPIPATENGLKFYDANADYMHEFPNAAPWLLPQVDGDSYSQYAADQMVGDGLRKRRSPEEFLRAMKFKTAARDYFATRDTYTAKIDQATVAGDKKQATALRGQLDWQLQLFRMAHPIFAEELQSSDGREQRARTLTEMRSVINDPGAPKSPQLAGLKRAMEVFDGYKTRLAVLGNNTSSRGRDEVEHLKQQFEQYMNAFVNANPAIMSFWVSVLRPEASL